MHQLAPWDYGSYSPTYLKGANCGSLSYGLRELSKPHSSEIELWPLMKTQILFSPLPPVLSCKPPKQTPQNILPSPKMLPKPAYKNNTRMQNCMKIPLFTIWLMLMKGSKLNKKQWKMTIKICRGGWQEKRTEASWVHSWWFSFIVQDLERGNLFH